MLPKNPSTQPTAAAQPTDRALYVAGPLARPVAGDQAAVVPLPQRSVARRLWVLGPLRQAVTARRRLRWSRVLRVVAGIAGAAVVAALLWLLVVAVVAAVTALIAWVQAHLLFIGLAVVAGLALLARVAGGGHRARCAGHHCRGCRR